MNQSETAYESIKRRILAGEISPGERLVEAQLADALALSRTPVREALGRLAAEQLISRDGSGSQVVTIPTRREVEEIYLIREVLEGLAARLAAQRMSESELMLSEAAMERFREAVRAGDGATLNTVNIAFHDLVYEAAGNERLQRMGRDLTEFVQLFSHRPMRTGSRGEEVIQEHEAIVEALREHDPEAAETSARDHVANARRMALRALAEDRLAATSA